MCNCKFIVLAHFILFTLACRVPASNPVLSLEETNTAITTIKTHDLKLPQESLVRRVERIRSITEPHGIKIAISDSVNVGMQVDWLELHNGTLAALLKYTCGSTMLRYRVKRGVVEFCKSDELTPEPSETDLTPLGEDSNGVNNDKSPFHPN
jgi:hypothetical protein